MNKRMKKNKIFLTLAAAASLLVSCNVVDDMQKSNLEKDDEAVRFGVYLNRGTDTKAGTGGELVTDVEAGKVDLKSAGFGVFGYYANGEMYSETSKPDFMYNTKVTYDDGEDVWTYSPLKYWPNEFGTEAVSEEVDRVTFFAYAPHVFVTPSTGIVETDPDKGITALSRNSATGDPMVKYISSLNPGGDVDLCWAVNENTGRPHIDAVKPNAKDKIKFNFKHALAALNVQIKADFSAERMTAEQEAATKIFVRSVSFEGFTTKGSLNLNSNWTSENTNPNWFDYAGTGKLSQDVVTIYDGRRDGKEAVSGAEARNETPSGLNPVVVQDGTSRAGVTETPVNLFDSETQTAPVYVIPTGEPMKVTIVYDVETVDDKLATTLSDGQTHGSSIENAITQEVTLTMQAGKKYTLSLNLGMTSVKFEADVTEWDEKSTINADLPVNRTGLSGVRFVQNDETFTGAIYAWKKENAASLVLPAPKFSFSDVDEQDLEGAKAILGSAITWSVSPATGVLTLGDDGAIASIDGVGSATVTVIALKDNVTYSSSYSINVNAVASVEFPTASHKFWAEDATTTVPAAVITYVGGGYGTAIPEPEIAYSASQALAGLALDTDTRVVTATLDDMTSPSLSDDYCMKVKASVAADYAESGDDAVESAADYEVHPVVTGVYYADGFSGNKGRVAGLNISRAFLLARGNGSGGVTYELSSDGDLNQLAGLKGYGSTDPTPDNIGSTSGTTPYISWVNLGKYFTNNDGFSASNGSFDSQQTVSFDGFKVPTQAQWAKIVNTDGTTRTASADIASLTTTYTGKHYTKITVTGLDAEVYGVSEIKGLLIFPDNAQVACKALANRAAGSTNYFDYTGNRYTSITLDNFKKLTKGDEACIFLPYCGRWGSMYSPAWNSRGSVGGYWSSTEGSDAAYGYALGIYNNGVNPASYYDKESFRSVRLVKE